MHRVSVRFECDISKASLFSALDEQGVKHYYDGTHSARVVITSVWDQHPSKEDHKNFQHLFKKMAEVIAKHKDHTVEITQLQNLKRTDSECNEAFISHAVAERLLNGVILFPAGLRFQYNNLEVDAIVLGVWVGREVMVLCESKHNMDTHVQQARKQLMRIRAYILDLRMLVTSGSEMSTEQVKDCDALGVAGNMQREIMFAFGAVKFTQIAESQLSSVTVPWFKVVPNPSSRFIASISTNQCSLANMDS